MNKTYSIYDIEIAYRKLKSYFYYDNFSMHIRKAIAEFESENNFENKFKIIESIVNSDKPNESKDFIRLLNKISILVIPKSYKDTLDNNDDEYILTNRTPSLPFKIDRINYLINAPIEIHIIAVLWIINEGFCLQESFDRYNYGYKVSLDSDTNKVVDGLILFEKYFNQYQKWRDISIETAKSLLEKKQDATIIQMDVKEYFHRIPLDFVELKGEISKNINYELRLSELLEKIYSTYFNKLIEINPNYKFDGNYFSLPIGLLSSGVIGNWYLKDFDELIVSKLAPSFYGRYVDDIILVLANTPINRSNEKGAFTSFIEEYFIKREILKQSINNEYLLNTRNNEKIKSIIIQKNKFSLLEFSHKESLAALNNFVVKLKENSSIFWMLPEDEKDSRDFDKNANDLIYRDSANKLRSLNEIIPSKFGASVFLAKRILSSLLDDESSDANTDNQILSFFKGRFALEFYQLWEKVITYFIINNKRKEFILFVKTCLNSIQELEYDKNVEQIQSFLTNHLKTSISLSISLNPNFLLNKKNSLYNKFVKIQNIIQLEEISKLSTAFRISNMIRHNYVTLPLLNYTKYSLKYNSPYLKPLLVENEIKFIEKLEASDLEINFKAYKYSPRYIHLFETNIHSFYAYLLKSPTLFNDGKIENFNKELAKILLDDSFENFYKLNYEYRKDIIQEQFKKYYQNKLYKTDYSSNKYVSIKIGSYDKSHKNKISIAVANHKIQEEDIELSMKNKLKFTNTKKQNLIRILNQSEEEKANLLLLPEITIPFKWLTIVADEARRKNRAIIGGIEHFSIKRLCYNFMVTVLPIRINGIQESIIIPRLKNHYSPEESKKISEIRYKVPKSNNYYYHLYKWKGISFATFNCYELADVEHRAIFKSKVDIIFASEYNKDWKYFSNIAESIARDIHCYYVQSNTSNIGDSRIVQPTESNRMDILRLKGGQKSSVLVGILDIEKLRNFQEKEYSGQKDLKTFKPTPPDFDKENVKKR